MLSSHVLSQVFELEQQHSAALQERLHTFIAEKEQLFDQHRLQTQVCDMHECTHTACVCESQSTLVLNICQ